MMQHKAQYQSRGCIFMGALLFVLMLSAVVQATPFTAPKKLADYLYYMEYSDYVPDLATGEQVKTGFACSSVRNGNFYGRNLDLDYADVPEFAIKVAAKEGRYASNGRESDHRERAHGFQGGCSVRLGYLQAARQEHSAR